MAKQLTPSKVTRAQEIAQKNLGRALSDTELQAVAANYNGSNLQNSVKLIGRLAPVLTGSTPSQPTQADPFESYRAAAEAAAAANLKNAQAAVAANRVNQVTPFGNVTYTQSGTDAQGNPIWTATQTLPEGLQKAYEGILGNVSSQYSQQFKPELPSVGINPGEEYEAAIMRRLEPVQTRQRQSLEADLANQGIMPGSEAYNRAKEQLSKAQNDQLTSAVVGGFQTGLAANQQGYNQALTNYQLPMATLNQFRTGAQPSFVNPPQQATVAGPDYLGAFTAQKNYDLGLQNAQAASNANLTGGLFGLGSAALMNPTGVSQIFSGLGSGLSSLGKGVSGAFNSIFG